MLLLICIITLFSIILTSIFIPYIILKSKNRNLFDDTEERKIHTGHISRLGGVAFLPSIMLSIITATTLIYIFKPSFLLVCIPSFKPSSLFLVVAFLILYIQGGIDDLKNINYKIKFITQLTAAYFITLSGIYFTSFYGFLGIYDLPIWFGKAFSIFFLTLIINAYNFIDGIDGLASGLAITAILFFGIISLLFNDFTYSISMFASAGTLMAFFYFNVFGNVEKGNKIFMGDCGSQTIGLLLGSSVIYFADYRSNQSLLIPPHLFILSFSTILILIFDIFRVFFWRISHSISPFTANNVHILHKLLCLGINSRYTMVSIILFNIFYIAINCLFVTCLSINKIFILNLFIWIVINLILNYLMKRKKVKLPYYRH